MIKTSLLLCVCGHITLDEQKVCMAVTEGQLDQQHAINDVTGVSTVNRISVGWD